jgi:hypothetical protein
MSDEEQDRLGWPEPYDFNIAASTDTGYTGRFKYSPDFTAAYCSRKCTIQMTGSRRLDYKAAETLTGGLRGRGETWHHVFPPEGVLNKDIHGNYYCDMELVPTRIHRRCCPHLGAVFLYPHPYKIPGAARSITWQELNLANPLKSPPDLAQILWEHGMLYALAPFGKSGDGEQVYIETIYSQQEAHDTVQDITIYPWFDALITDLGWYPIGEDGCGNILFWMQVGKIFDGTFLYVVHDECAGGSCKMFDAFSRCGDNYEAFAEKFLIPLSALP